MARRVVHLTCGAAQAAHPDPREPEQLGVRVTRRSGAAYELERMDAAAIRLPRRLSHRHRDDTWVLDEDDAGRWLRGELPRQVEAAVTGAQTWPAVAWGGAIGERHIRRHLSRASDRRSVAREIARLLPWAGHPAMSPAIWWEVCFPRRGLGLAPRLRRSFTAWSGLDDALRRVARADGLVTAADPDRELRSVLSVMPWLSRALVGPHARYCEVWWLGDDGRRELRLDDCPGLELLVRTPSPVRVAGTGVVLELGAYQLALLRCDEGGWRRLDATGR